MNKEDIAGLRRLMRLLEDSDDVKAVRYARADLLDAIPALLDIVERTLDPPKVTQYGCTCSAGFPLCPHPDMCIDMHKRFNSPLPMYWGEV